VNGGLGTVVGISRFPVKSMRAEALETAELFWTGLQGDRQYAFLKSTDTSDFPWLTARDLPGLVLHRACYADPADPDHARVRVTDPQGVGRDVRDPALAASLAAAARAPVSLLRVGRGAYDAMPVSVITTGTRAAIEAAHGGPVALERFRANLVIRPDDPAATERDWLGHTISFGDGPDPPAVRLDWPIPRCAIVAIDPGTAARDPGVLRTVVQRFGNAVGAYCAVQAPGTVRIGERVRLAGG